MAETLSESQEETEQVSSDTDSSNQLPDKEEFERKRNILVERMQADPEVRDKIIAEIYLNIATMEMAIRGMFETVQQQGMAGILRGMMGRSR